MAILLLASVVGLAAAAAALWLAVSLLRGRGASVGASRVTAGAAGAAIPPPNQAGAVGTRPRVAAERSPPRFVVEREAVAVVRPERAEPMPEPRDPKPEPHDPKAEPEPPQIRWWTAFDARSRELDDRSRLRLIGDLGVVGKEWCVPLLAQAYEQERDSGHRQAALVALAACRSRAAIATFRRALLAKDAAEIAIATDALADLEPPAAVRRRHTVERY